MEDNEDLYEVSSADGRKLWLGAAVDWQFAEDGAGYHLPLFMWLVGVREDEDRILMDRDEPFVSVRRAVELAGTESDAILEACQSLIGRTRRDLTILGFSPDHPYRDEVRRFADAVRREKASLLRGSVELAGTPVTAPATMPAS